MKEFKEFKELHREDRGRGTEDTEKTVRREFTGSGALTSGKTIPPGYDHKRGKVAALQSLGFDEDAGAFGLLASVFFFDLVEGTEAFGFEAALRERWFAGARVVEAHEEDADFAFFALEADADGHFTDDINDAGFGQGDVKLLDPERELVINANNFRTDCHAREKI